MPSWTKAVAVAVALEVTEARLRRNDLMLLGRHRLRHPRVRLDPAALGIVADAPGLHLLGRVRHQQLDRQRAGLQPAAGRFRAKDRRPAVVHTHHPP